MGPACVQTSFPLISHNCDGLCDIWCFMLRTGGDGVVYTWDLRTRRCLSQVSDHGNVSPSSLMVSEDGRFFATGSEAGVVNLYRRGAETGEVARVLNPLLPALMLAWWTCTGREMKQVSPNVC